MMLLTLMAATISLTYASVALLTILLALSLAALVAVTYVPVRARLKRAIDILLYRDYYEFGPTLQRFSQELALLRDEEGVISLLLDGLVETLNLTGIAFVPLPEGLMQPMLGVIEANDLRARRAFATLEGRSAVLRGLASLDMASLPLSWHAPLLLNPWEGCAALALVGQASGSEGIALLVIGPKATGGMLRRNDQALLVTLAHQAATALANAMLVAGLKTSLAQVRISTEQLVEARAEQQLLLRELVDADERQRAALAHDLHDDALQEVLYLIRHSRLCTELAETLSRNEATSTGGPPTPSASGSRHMKGGAPERLRQELRQLTERSIVVESKLRSLYLGLYPALLPSLGLPAALEDLARELAVSTGLDIQLSYDDDMRSAALLLDSEVALHIYRIVQEALRNAGKHADASTALVRLSMMRLSSEIPTGRRGAFRQFIRLEVTDSGKGMTLPVDYVALLREGHLGLAGMRERAERIGGTLEIQEAASGGARIVVTVPLKSAGIVSSSKNSEAASARR